MKILIINPNISERTTASIDSIAKTIVAGSDVSITTTSSAFGVEYISTWAENVVGAHGALAAFAEASKAGPFDAVIVASFSDAGAEAIREVAGCPVVGMAQAAMGAAARIGRFAVINSAPGLKALIRERAVSAGLGERLAGIVCAPEGSIRLAVDFDAGVDVLVGLANEAIDTLGAEVIVVGGAPISDAARAVRARVAVPVVEGISEAVRRALQPQPSDVLPKRVAARPAKRAVGIAPSLAGVIGAALEAASAR